MNPIDLIAKKRDGETLDLEELKFFIDGYVRGDIPDYQVAAFLMAVFFQGMTPAETSWLTRVMRDSGVVLDLSNVPGFKIDKHSTGGVGDKVSLVLAPLMAAAGLVVPMMSGRALAHTGGTLDKLEAIPGFRTNLSIPEFEKQLRDIGVALIGQTDDLCPADKKIYALRDATATVNAIPLITASILSKKMAEGIDALVLDVKVGSGAIFAEPEKSWELARMLVHTAREFGLRTTALLTSMQQPLGRAVGNWLETREAIETLRGDGPPDLVRVTLALGAEMMLLSGKMSDPQAAERHLSALLHDGRAYAKFLEIAKHQGGDVAVIEHPETYPKAKHELAIRSPAAGTVAAVHGREIGRLSMQLGAGRTSVDDGVDYTAGIYLHKKVGDAVAPGDVLCVAYSNQEARLQEARPRLEAAFTITPSEVAGDPLLLGRIDFDGETRWDEAGA